MMSRAGTTSSTPKITAASLTIPAATTSSTPRDSLRPAGCLPGLALPAQHQGSLWPARCLPAVTAGLTPRLSAATDVYQLALLAQHQGSLWPAWCLPARTTGSTPRLAVATSMSTSWHYWLNTKALSGQLDVYQLALPAQHQGSLQPAPCLPAGTTSSTPRLTSANSTSTSWHYRLNTNAHCSQLNVYQLTLPAQHQGSLQPIRHLPAGTTSSTPRLTVASSMSTSWQLMQEAHFVTLQFVSHQSGVCENNGSTVITQSMIIFSTNCRK